MIADKENCLALLFIFFVAIIFLHPIFLGKVDIPVDIRNIQMYPWRYYTVDKKAKESTVWQGIFPNSLQVFDLKTAPNETNSILFKLNLDESILKVLPNARGSDCYLSFDFKSAYADSVAFDFGVTLVNNFTGRHYKPRAAVVPVSDYIEDKTSSWYRAYFPLYAFISQLSEINDLSSYSIKIIVKNKSKNSFAFMSLKNLRLVFKDFSQVKNIHNYFLDDVIQSFVPAREFYSNSIKKGILPFWTNDLLTGAEFLAEPQVGYFHPFYFLSYLFFDHFTAHSLIVFICFVLCGYGAYLLAKHWRLSLGAALFTGVVFMFHPFNITWFSCEHVLMCSATLPFLIITYEKCIKRKELLNKYLLISSALLGLIFISGHLQHVYYTVIFFFLFAVFRFIENIIIDKKGGLKHLFSILFVFIPALMIGAIVTVPFFPLLKDSYRVSWSIDFVKANSIPLKAFLGVFFPYYGGYPKWSIAEGFSLGWSFFNNYVYFGFLPFIFLLFSISVLFKNKLTLFFFLTILFSILVSTGSSFFFLIRDFIPGFKQLQHIRFLQVYSFCVPFLAGIGLEVTLNYFTKMRVRRILVSVVLLVSVIDLIYHSSYFLTWSNRKEYKPLTKGGALEFLTREKDKSKEPFRVLPFTVKRIKEIGEIADVAKPNALQPYKLEDASGYRSIVSKDLYYLFVYSLTREPKLLYQKEIRKEITDLFFNVNVPYPINNFKSQIIDLLNVKYFLVPNVLFLQSDKVIKVFSGDCSIYENKNYLPRAFFVPDYKVIESPKETIIELDSEEFDPRKKVILMSDPKLKLGKETSKLYYNIDFVKYDHNNITLKAKTNKSGFLILGHNLNDNWRVKVNNKQEKHFQANLVQRGVYLNAPGDYLIEFYYYPKLFIIGGLISSLGVLILICLGFYLIVPFSHKQLFHKTQDIF